MTRRKRYSGEFKCKAVELLENRDRHGSDSATPIDTHILTVRIIILITEVRTALEHGRSECFFNTRQAPFIDWGIFVIDQ